jgi:hypothetical protein
MHDGRRVNAHPRAAVDRCAREREQQLGLGDDAVSQVGGAVRARQAGPARTEGDLQPEPIAGSHREPELRVIDAAQVGTPAAVRAAHEQHRGDLGERLDHEDAGQRRRAREVPLEELLVHRHVLDGDDAATGFELGHRIHQRGWIAVTETVDDLRDVD